MTEAMLGAAVPGETPVTAISANLKLTGRRLAPDAVEGEALSAPLTAAEIKAGVQPAGMRLPRTDAADTANATALDMQLAQYGANVLGAGNATNLSFTTSPVRAAVFSKGADGTRRRAISSPPVPGETPALVSESAFV